MAATPAFDLTPARAGRPLTVEAWIATDRDLVEGLQPLVSQWQPCARLTFSAYDVTHLDGLHCGGNYGAVFDGRHVYGCPIRSHRSRDSVNGHVWRCDTHAEFHDPAAWEAYDADGTDGLRTVCYYGAAFDGRHVIFCPRDDGAGYHSRVLRYDTRAPFKDRDAWSAHDADLPHSAQGCAYDGRHLYFCPGYVSRPSEPLNESTLSGTILRMDTQGEFRSAATYQRFDTLCLHPDAACFDGGAFDGRYVYFVPLMKGVVVRHDTQGSFHDPATWECFDARSVGLGMNVGAIFDGRYLTFCAYGHSVMVRYDTTRPFTDAASWHFYDAAGTDGLDGGFDGGVFDGRWLTFIPWTRKAAPGEPLFHGRLLRHDTTRAFDDAAAWHAVDISHVDGLHTLGYNGAAFDGRYLYGAPLYDGVGLDYHGRVLRADTLGSDGAFSLRACDLGHNGGLCAAAPGPTFLVNTDGGARGVSAHRALQAGRHHLKGVYDGTRLQLWIDGQLVAERPAAGRLVETAVPVTAGGFSGGGATFGGTIERAVVGVG